MSELKPCPFCGGEADAIRAVGETWVRCMTCEASGPSSSDHAFAVTAWNTRAEGPRPKPSQEAVERLRENLTDSAPSDKTMVASEDLAALLASFSDAPSDGGA